MAWTYRVTDGTRRRPAGHIGYAPTRAEAQALRQAKCRTGGYITRETDISTAAAAATLGRRGGLADSPAQRAHRATLHTSSPHTGRPAGTYVVGDHSYRISDVQRAVVNGRSARVFTAHQKQGDAYVHGGRFDAPARATRQAMAEIADQQTSGSPARACHCGQPICERCNSVCPHCQASW